MNNFIQVFEPKVQQELVALGFNYTKTEINGKTVYAFADTDELQEYLAKKYTDEEWHYIRSNKLFF